MPRDGTLRDGLGLLDHAGLPRATEAEIDDYLDHWHRFETENPRAFIGMYQFWVQRNR